VAVTDLTSDMLTMIRNASRAGKESVEIKFSNMLDSICGIMKKEGFITNYKDITSGNFKAIKVYLKYGKSGAPAITGLKKISRPGLRAYKGYDEIKPVFGGIGISVLSTSQGMLTGSEARTKKVGGEVICEIW